MFQVRALFTVQRTRLDLLPFYSRLAATMHPYIPEVSTDLCNFLKQDFKYHVRKKVWNPVPVRSNRISFKVNFPPPELLTGPNQHRDQSENRPFHR